MPKRLDADFAFACMMKAALEPLEPYVNSTTKWRCKCLTCGEIVYPKLTNIRAGDGGCRFCGIRKQQASTRLSESSAVKVMRNAGLKPLEIYPGSKQPWKSKCLSCGAIVFPKYTNIQSGDGGCSDCGQKKRSKSLRNSHDDAVKVMLKANLIPLENYEGNNKPWKSRCTKCGAIVFPKYTNIQSGDGGCKYCGGNYVSPEAAVATMRASFLEPLEDYVQTNARWRCRCLRCGRIVTPTHASVKSGQGGCLACGNAISAEKRKLAPDKAVALMLSASLEPLEPYVSSANPWKCRCLKCQGIVYPRYSGIQSGQGGCVTCAGKFIDPDLAFSIMISSGLEPLTPYPGSHGGWKSKCLKCGKIVSPWFPTVRDGGGCSNCAHYGYKEEEPAYLYLITSETFGAHKIGVGNAGKRTNKDRLHAHVLKGWSAYRKWDFENGGVALSVESRCLSVMRNDLGFPPYLTKEAMPQGGWTETISSEALTLLNLANLIEMLIMENS